MRITSSAVSLNVNDVAASSTFLTTHFGFREEMAADGFASLTRDDAGMNVVFLWRGLESLPEDQRSTPAAGLILAFVVDDLECELTRLQGRSRHHHRAADGRGVGGARLSGRDPNGVIIQLVDWKVPTS
jgi:catechol 2,3-dioxygenase-like lactoylglutathione lyase family enzyme